MSDAASPRSATRSRAGFRTLTYALCGLALGASLTVGGYLVDHFHLYGAIPWSPSLGLLRGLHEVTPVHYFADLFALILAGAGALAGWLQDKVLFYSSRMEELVAIRTRELATSEQRYALAAEGSNDGIWDWDLSANRVHYSSRWRQMIGYEGVEIGDAPDAWFARVHPEDLGRLREALRAHQESHTVGLDVEYRMRHADGTYRWMHARGATARDASGRARRTAGSQTDIDQRRRGEDQLRHLALHDQLTGLPNRTLLLDRLNQILARARRTHAPFLVLHLGLDRFRKINESLGPLVGDRLLVDSARRLTSQLSHFLARGDAPGASGSLYRYGGDEFVLVLEDAGSVREATRLAGLILAAMEEPFRAESRDVRVSLSIGIVVGPDRHKDADGMLRDAQTAMNRAKLQGSNRFEAFDRDMQVAGRSELHLETELFNALEQHQLLLWYQPVFDLASQAVVGFEALIRWEHPSRGIISPEEFIPLAEETGLIVGMSRRLLEEVLTQQVRWDADLGAIDLVMNMNLSPKWLFHPDLESDLVELLRMTGADPSRVHLEVTETSFIDRPDAVARVLRRLKKLGFRIALDDFGTGYSSLSMLHELPFDVLKIDKRFVSKLTADPAVENIVAMILDLSRSLGLSVVAEGIETRAQLAMLRDMRCKQGQGYLLGRPMTVQAAEKILKRGLARHKRGRAAGV